MINLPKNKRLLYLSPSVFPSTTANSIQVIKMCEAFSSSGYNVNLIGFKSEKSNVKGILKYYNVKYPFKVYRIKRLKNLNRIFKILYSYFIFLISNPDLIYSRNLHLSLVIAKISNRKHYIEFHDLIKDKYVNDFKKYFLAKKFMKVVLITESLKREFLKSYPWINEEYISIAPDGFDPTIFNKIDKSTARNSLGFNNFDKVALYVGSFYKGKGVEIILPLALKLKNIKFVLIGGSPQEIQGIMSYYTTENLDNIKFIGFVPYSKISLYYACADYLLMPYQNKVNVSGNSGDVSRWMSPLKMFEYLASGKPIISSNLPVLKEILVHDYNCLMVSPNNLEEWIFSFYRLLDSDQLCRRLSENALKTSEKYTWQNRVHFIMNK